MRNVHAQTVEAVAVVMELVFRSYPMRSTPSGAGRAGQQPPLSRVRSWYGGEFSGYTQG